MEYCHGNAGLVNEFGVSRAQMQAVLAFAVLSVGRASLLSPANAPFAMPDAMP